MPVAPIVTPDDLAAYQAGDPQQLLDAATAEARSYCRWHVTPSLSETVTLDGPGGQTLLLPSLHVTAVSSVTADGTLLVADTDYTWSQVGVLTRVDGCWPWTTGSVVVAFTHGYDEAPDLAKVILARASRSQSNHTVAKSVTTGPFSESYDLAFFADEYATLDRYRLPSRP